MGAKVKTPDRRVQRTHRMLRDALITMIIERGWDEVSVQDVCERADIGRSTFYTHFADKEELLLSGFDDLHMELRERQRTSQSTGLRFTRGVIEHVQGHKRLASAVIGKRSGLVVQRRFKQLMTTLLREELSEFVAAGPGLELAVRYLSGAFFELLAWWLDTRNTISPENLEENFQRLTAPVLMMLRLEKK